MTNQTPNKRLTAIPQAGQTTAAIIKPTLTPDEITTGNDQATYGNYLQGPATNALARSSSRQASINKITGAGRIQTPEGFEILLANAEMNLDTQTHKLLQALTLILTRSLPTGRRITADEINKKRGVLLTLDSYMELIGLKNTKDNRKDARKRLISSLTNLYNISLKGSYQTYTKGKDGKRVKDTANLDARIADIKGDMDISGDIYFKFSFDYAEYLSQQYIMPYNLNAFKIDHRYNRNSWYFQYKLHTHHNMNRGASNSNIIAVKTLLEASPEAVDYESIAGAGQITRRIIEPFERDMNALLPPSENDLGERRYSVLSSWEYCNPKGEPLTEDQLQNMDYATFSSLLVKFEFCNYPDAAPQKKRG